MTRRIALITTVLALALAAPAGAQSGPFGPLPPADPTPTPTPERTSIGDDDLSLGTLLLIGGALLAGFAVMGWFIMRDARRSLPEAERVGPRLREEGPHKRPKHAKERARAKTRAQKQARKAHRKR
ncbi:MAG TPA: hypothetical protein VFZ00_24855 [Solirubrobacter sp.]|nr:hypothetical protein [Solirubrobacter sp.]